MRTALPFSIAFFWAATLHGDETNGAKVLGLDNDKGAVPVWTEPEGSARESLGKVARAAERGVFLVGGPGAGHGTAWVFSKKNRWLVTNAHVADLFHTSGKKLFAIPNGTSQLYTVEKVWYHPGVRRYLKGNTAFSVRSEDPNDGKIDPVSPDLALLQLAADGPELPFEFQLATAAELAALFAQPAAMFGFPGHDTRGWPRLGDTAAGTYHEGVISRVTDFLLNPGAPQSELQFLQYTMSSWGGFSGSPVFLPNGHVVAVHNMSRAAKGSFGDIKSIPHGIRVDCLLELLVHHKLDEQAPLKIDKSQVSLARWLAPDERTTKARGDYTRAAALTQEATILITNGKYDAAVAKCNEAIRIAPTFVDAYDARQRAKSWDFAANQSRMPRERQLALLNEAVEDARKCISLAPSRSGYVIELASNLNNMALVTSDKAIDRTNLSLMDELLSSKNLNNHERSMALGIRGSAKSHLQDFPAARRDYDEAVRINPKEPAVYLNRGDFLRNTLTGDRGAADQAKADELLAYQSSGMRIERLLSGGAAEKANLRPGDIIVKVGGYRTRTLAELQHELAEAHGSVEVFYFSAQTRKMEVTHITPVEGKIGTEVTSVVLP